MEILATNTSGRRDKNDILLQDLINAKNWKQALASCEKRIKKGEKGDVLLVGVQSKANFSLRVLKI